MFVFGNPPYLGARLQEPDQKEDMRIAVGDDLAYNNLDYITTWFYKGTNYVKDCNAKLAFVTTNSICQGEQVPLLWEYIFSQRVFISFAYTSFKWTNNAKYNAGVTCVILGLSCLGNGKRFLYSNDGVKVVDNITPYLTAAKTNIINKHSSPISGFAPMSFGSMPNDGGSLLLDSQEKEAILQEDERCLEFIHPLLGAQEFIRGEKRFCLWITEDTFEKANSINPLRKRIDRCRQIREESKRASTRKLSEKPFSFGEVRYEETECIIVPGVSSENRKYIPMGYLEKGTVVTNSAFAIYDASLWLFGILTSEMHMVWVRTVGGRLKTDYRYSAGLCYNTFPFPSISSSKKSEIEEAATEVLLARENYPKKTLADLYDPDKMPADLREAHENLDRIVESCYPGAPFANDEARLECLFKLYEKMTVNKK